MRNSEAPPREKRFFSLLMSIDIALRELRLSSFSSVNDSRERAISSCSFVMMGRIDQRPGISGASTGEEFEDNSEDGNDRSLPPKSPNEVFSEGPNVSASNDSSCAGGLGSGKQMSLRAMERSTCPAFVLPIMEIVS